MQKFKSIRGFNDVLPQDINKVQFVESFITNILNKSGFKEIRTPIMEYEDLFKRSVGTESDIVSKEMYTIKRNDEKSFTLRPEGTVGVARALLENNLLSIPQKIWYNGYMFRAENPQKGRYRQFQQIGVEAYGIEGINIELELLYMTNSIFEKLGLLDSISLEINNIGTKEDRTKYSDELKRFFKPYYESFDDEFINKFEKNPLRILDNKDTNIKNIIKDAPLINDFINEESKKSFNDLKSKLELLGVSYTINENLVRGLDYYNDLVFEWTSNLSQSQGTICAGGRYDSLIEELGGKSSPAFGFAIGVERLILLMEELNLIKENISDKIVICTLDKQNYLFALKLQRELAYNTQKEVIIINEQTSLKSQMKKADKLNAKYVILIGQMEIESNNILLKNMENGEQMTVNINKVTEIIKDL